jgi:hypothetical protein
VGTTGPAGGSAKARTVAACTDQSVALVAQVAESSYRVGQKPLFRLVIANIGDKPCSRDLDPGLQSLVVNSPTGQLWNSNNCDSSHHPDVRVLDPGKPAVFSLAWAARTSHPGCTGAREAVGPGSYMLVGRLGRLASGPAPFTLVGPGQKSVPQAGGPKQGTTPRVTGPQQGVGPKGVGPKPNADQAAARPIGQSG